MNYRLMDFSITTAMGVDLDENQQIEKGSFVRVHHPDEAAPRQNMQPNLFGLMRHVALWQQQGWVALDEMQFYGEAINTRHPGAIAAIVNIPHQEDAPFMFARQVVDTAKSIEHLIHPEAAIIFLYEQHWIPILIRIEASVPAKQVHIQTTRAESSAHSASIILDTVVGNLHLVVCTPSPGRMM